MDGADGGNKAFCELMVFGQIGGHQAASILKGDQVAERHALGLTGSTAMTLEAATVDYLSPGCGKRGFCPAPSVPFG